MATARNLIVINDEAHHAWRVPPKIEGHRRVKKEDVEEATKWVGGLDRIHRARGILTCYDFSATPFVPSGKKSYRGGALRLDRERLRPQRRHRVRAGEDPASSSATTACPTSKTYKSQLYHIYNDAEVKDDLNRRAPSRTSRCPTW